MKKRYNITVNPAIITAIDEMAEERGISRSALVNHILYIFAEDDGRAIKDFDEAEFETTEQCKFLGV